MGIFFQNLGHDRTDAEVYAQQLSMAGTAEPLGFQSLWAPEHHFTDYTMCPDVLQFLSWAAARTTRIRLGSMVVVLPWHDPVRVAEKVCVLDHLSGGRAILGIGRGLARVEFEGFRVEMGESRRRFIEYATAILEALETGFIEADGELYRQPRTAIRPAPLSTFRGRVYASSISPESAEIMARLGVGIMIFAQKPWPTTIDDIERYRSIYSELNGTDPPKPLLVSFVAVHESEAAAEELYENHIVRYCASTLDHYEFANAGLGSIEGYEYYGRLAENIDRHGPDRFARFLADLQVWGTPDRVTERLTEIMRSIDGAGVIAVFSYGGMPDDAAHANARLFAAKVLPNLQQAS